jgi:hypothetical protein
VKAGLITSIEGSGGSEGREATGGQRPGEAHGTGMAKRLEVGDDKRAPPIGGGERREGGRWNGLG